jgi:hypothetical protein
LRFFFVDIFCFLLFDFLRFLFGRRRRLWCGFGSLFFGDYNHYLFFFGWGRRWFFSDGLDYWRRLRFGRLLYLWVGRQEVLRIRLV